MRYRNLRIAWSVFWGVACVVLIVLWVRSYWRADCINLTPTSSVYSSLGCFCATYDSTMRNIRWYDGFRAGVLGPRSGDVFGFNFRDDAPPPFTCYYVQLPYWFVFLTLIVAASAPWLSRRFSLRTLLIATALVALVLGAIVYLSTKPPASPPLDVGDFDKRIN